MGYGRLYAVGGSSNLNRTSKAMPVRCCLGAVSLGYAWGCTLGTQRCGTTR